MRGQQTDDTSLSAAELLALELIVEGRTDQEIADAVGIERDAVPTFVEKIAVKMEALSPLEAGVKALREGLIGPGTDSFLRRSRT